MCQAILMCVHVEVEAQGRGACWACAMPCAVRHNIITAATAAAAAHAPAHPGPCTRASYAYVPVQAYVYLQTTSDSLSGTSLSLSEAPRHPARASHASAGRCACQRKNMHFRRHVPSCARHVAALMLTSTLHLRSMCPAVAGVCSERATPLHSSSP